MAVDEALRRTARGILSGLQHKHDLNYESKAIPSPSISEFLRESSEKRR